MWPEAMSALDELGVGESVRRHSVLSRGATILEPSGGVIARIRDDRHAHLISRARLLTSLHAELPPGTVHWDSPIASALDLPDADLIVGADGIHSAVRSTMWGRNAERALGTVAFRGVLEGEVAEVTETWGDGALFGITPSSDGQTNWFACVRSDDSAAAASDVAAGLADRFAGWHAAVADIVGRLENDAIDRRELFDVSVRHPYVSGNVALVGDAAHAMAPNLGRGACESLLDAVTLARAVAGEPDVASALRSYDRARRRRTQRIVRAARTVNGISTARRGVRLRNAGMRMLLPTSRPAALPRPTMSA
jgi:2-polyprenyl-6-methoxyphenol hydroxylase-like FAD-dependent oxidoreductase